MKKLLTLIALLAVFMGVKAEWVEDYKIDYSRYSGFPFYVMGYVPEWVDGVMTDYGAKYKYVLVDNEDGEESDVIVTTNSGVQYYRIPLESPGWHQYFIADGINTSDMADVYTVKALVKASTDCTINVNMCWGWGEGQQLGNSVFIPGGEWTEVEWEYDGIGGASCFLIAQPGTCEAIIEWKSLEVGHSTKEVRPVEWIENLVNGDAKMSWEEMGLADVRFNDLENNYKICAWSKERGVNMNEYDAWDPFPATIERIDGNNVFVVHGKAATTEGDPSAWDNQFWIQSPKAWKAGTQLKIKFRYRASQNVKTNTQIHKQAPGDYLIWHAIGDINFTEDWQEFDGTMTMGDDMDGGWSIAFNLNPEVKDAVDFYFDDLSWQNMKLDEGYFVAGCNTITGLGYDFDNAIEFTQYEDWGLVATIGTKDAYVNQIMISTARGNDAAFKGNTLKPNGTIENNPDVWIDYTAATNAKINLPGEGVWKIYIDPEYSAMAFEMIEGKNIDPIEINPNPTEVVVHAWERDWLTADSDGNPREEEIGNGATWDNQFFIVANRPLQAGETTIVEFEYRAPKYARTTTQCHGEPGAYMHWAAIGDVNFDEEWQYFSREFTIPQEADGMRSIAFNMAEIKDANDYYIKNIIWKLSDNTESLIEQVGAGNFFVKEGAGNAVVPFTENSNVRVWTLAGSGEIFGSTWDPSDSDNDMTEIEDGVFELIKHNVYLEAGNSYWFKVVGNHSWDINYGADGIRNGDNVEIVVGQSGTYDFTFYFYPNGGYKLDYVYNYVSGDPGKEELVYNIDYSYYSGFPFYVMGYVPEWYNGIMTDLGANFKYVEVKEDAEETSDVIVTTATGAQYYRIPTEGAWHQYFIADGIPTTIDGNYIIRAKVRASEPCTINVNMGWGWGDGQQTGASVAIGTEWQEVEWSYDGIGGTSCNLVAQPGTTTAQIEWASLAVYYINNQGPVEWVELLTNGDAENSWKSLGVDGIKYNDIDNSKVCAWIKEKGVNLDAEGNWEPFPARIEGEEDTDNHVFVVHGKLADSEEAEDGTDPSEWDNQFWMMSPRVWKAGEQAKIHFRYKATREARTRTEIHRNPSDYIYWNALGDIYFKEDWQEYDGIITFDDSNAGCKSIAFSLNLDVKEPTDFYFDDLSWQAIDGQIANTTTWTIAGSGEIFGSTWDPGDTNNDMTEVQEGVFALTKRNIKLDAGYVYEFKVVANHSWDENYGANGEYYGPNVQIVVDQTGMYNLQILFDRNAGNWLSYSVSECTINVPTALDIISNLYEGEITDEYYAVKGVVTEIKEISTTYGNATFYIQSPEVSDQTLYVYRAYGFNGEKITDANLFAVGDEVVIYSQLQNYKGIPETRQGGYLMSINKDNNPATILARLTEQIAITEAAIDSLAYANVPGVTELKALVADAKTATVESGTEVLNNYINQLIYQTRTVVALDQDYQSLADLMNRIELAIQNNPNANPELAVEASNKIQEARTGLNNGSYDESSIWNMMDLMNYYYVELSKVYLTINVEEPGTLRALIEEKGFDLSSIIGLTVSGSLDYNDMNALNEMYNIEQLDMAETNITEIWSWMFCGRPLKSVVLPKNLQRINNYAFAWCNNLTAIELPATLQYLEYNIFEGCYNLKSITYSSIIPIELNDQLMGWDYASQCTLYVPAIVASVYQSASYWNWFQIVGTDIIPENIIVNRTITVDWPEGIGTTFKPNVAITNSQYNTEQFGSLTINGNSTISMNNFNILWDSRRSEWYSTYNEQTGSSEPYRFAYASLIANAPMRADNVSVSLNTNTYRWNFLTFPFDVKVGDIINLNQTNAPLVIRRYDGKNRAEGKMGETWVDMTPDMTLEAGKGYIWQSAEGDQNNSENDFSVPALDNAKKNNIFTANDVTVQLEENLSEFSWNRSWNLIGNPYPAFYDIRAMQTTAPITIWNVNNQVYQAYVPGDDNYILNPGQAFFIQRPLDQESITFLKEGRQANLVVRDKIGGNVTRAAKNSERFVFNLILTGSEEKQGDRTRIVFNAEAKSDYEAGRDASKFMSPEASAAQIFTTVGDLRYAINERPAMDGIVELGLSIGTAGSYTIALNTMVENEVFLIDRETGNETRIDGGSTYTFNANKGTIEGRFALRFGNGEVTGIKAIVSDSNKADNWYNLKGQRVNAPTKGLYIQNGKKTVVK